MRVATMMAVLTLFAAMATAEDRMVVVPDGPSKFTVLTSQVVRVRAQGIAGSKITAQVEGPAKILYENAVVTVKDGKRPLGVTVREFEVKPTGKGQVSVLVTVTPPQPNAAPKVEKYDIEVR